MSQLSRRNKYIRKIDEAMGWIEEDGTSPATQAEAHGSEAVAFGDDFAWLDRKTRSLVYIELNYRGVCYSVFARSIPLLRKEFRRWRRRIDTLWKQSKCTNGMYTNDPAYLITRRTPRHWAKEKRLAKPPYHYAKEWGVDLSSVMTCPGLNAVQAELSRTHDARRKAAEITP